MSILGSIMSSILGGRAQAAPLPPPVAMPSAGERARPIPATSAASPAPGPQSILQPSSQVDVATVLDKLAEATAQKLDWRASIVDLMKLLKLDSGLGARKTLAKELRYAGDTKDTAVMNMWLHRQVMTKLEQGGGKLPADLKH